jgi:hypothetical protein
MHLITENGRVVVRGVAPALGPPVKGQAPSDVFPPHLLFHRHLDDEVKDGVAAPSCLEDLVQQQACTFSDRCPLTRPYNTCRRSPAVLASRSISERGMRALRFLP